MADLEDTFTKLLGHTPSDVERQNLYRVKDALGIKSNDALWLVLMALRHHQTLYEAMPAQIAKTASDTLEQIKATADAEVAASMAAVKQDLAAAVATAATQVASNVSSKQKWQWAAGSIVAAFFSLGGLAVFMYYAGEKAGHDVGYSQGYGSAKDEKAAAAWANTPQGRMAYRLAINGFLDIIKACKLGPGWKTENGNCYPYADEKGMLTGWKIP